MGDDEKKVNKRVYIVTEVDMKQDFCNISRDIYIYMDKSCQKYAFDIKMCLIKKNADKN